MIPASIRLAMPAEQLGLSRCEAELLGLLLSEDRWWTSRELWQRMTTQSADQKTVKVFASRINRKLQAANVSRIEGRVKRGGFRIPEPERSRLLNWPTQQSAAA